MKEFVVGSLGFEWYEIRRRGDNLVIATVREDCRIFDRWIWRKSRTEIWREV